MERVFLASFQEETFWKLYSHGGFINTSRVNLQTLVTGNAQNKLYLEGSLVEEPLGLFL